MSFWCMLKITKKMFWEFIFRMNVYVEIMLHKKIDADGDEEEDDEKIYIFVLISSDPTSEVMLISWYSFSFCRVIRTKKSSLSYTN